MPIFPSIQSISLFHVSPKAETRATRHSRPSFSISSVYDSGHFTNLWQSGKPCGDRSTLARPIRLACSPYNPKLELNQYHSIWASATGAIPKFQTWAYTMKGFPPQQFSLWFGGIVGVMLGSQKLLKYQEQQISIYAYNPFLSSQSGRSLCASFQKASEWFLCLIWQSSCTRI